MAYSDAKQDTYALLISGEELRHIDGVAKFKIFLLNELNFSPENIEVVIGQEERLIFGRTLRFFERVKDENSQSDVVLLYNGHGGRGTFFPHSASSSYSGWGRLIDHEGDFIFINDSCYSGSSIDSFKEIGLLPHKGMLQTSASRDEWSYGSVNFLDKLVESYLTNQSFRRKKIGENEYVELTKIKIKFSRPPKGTILSDDDIVVGHSDGKKVFDPRISKYGFHGSGFHHRYKKPRIEGKIQHPQRAGKTLDHLLFKNPE